MSATQAEPPQRLRAGRPRLPRPPLLEADRPEAPAVAAESFAAVARPELPPELGAERLADRAAFDRLAQRSAVPGALDVPQVKFVVTGVDGDQPVLYFANTRRFEYHYDFARGALGVSIPLAEFNRRTYFTEERSFLAASLLAFDGFQGVPERRGLYGLEFWPADPAGVRHVALAYRLLLAAAPFLESRLAYHPAGESQVRRTERERADFELAGVPVVTTEELYGDIAYNPLNPGVGFGRLRVLDGLEQRPPAIRDVVVFTTLPNDLAHVAGVITETPQTPLSHINLKAKQNDTPNAFIRDAATADRIAPLVGDNVRFEVAADDYSIRAATQNEVEEFLEALRPAEPQFPPRDLARTGIAPLEELRHADLASVGAKAANLAELLRLFPDGTVPTGFAVPFFFYDRFLGANDLDGEAEAMMADPAFRGDVEERERRLKAFRKQIRRGRLPDELDEALEAMHDGFLERGLTPRCRSSTNNEDLEGFNGAGLYDSFTHREDEGPIGKSIRQVWASLWNFRAFEERDFYRIDHLTAAMGVLVHRNFDAERVNGVAVTRNIVDPRREGYYLNAQVGEDLVTNPQPGDRPDELLVFPSGDGSRLEIQYVSRSNRTEEGRDVMTRDEILDLVERLRRIQERFAAVYGRVGDPTFAMDVEFKIDVAGRPVIKQARPWVD